jgi:hypothetical protein
MAKKAILGTLLVGLIGVLVAGAIIRTVDRTANVAEARNLGRGRAGAESADLGTTTLARGQGGYGRNSTAAERQYPNYTVAPADWKVVTGTVIETPAAGVDLVIETASGEELTVGMGPGYLADQGFALQAGEQVQVNGYWEDGEFKAAQLTRLRDGELLTLRDQVGRPAWAGGGQGQATAAGDGSGIPQPEAEVDEWLTFDGAVTGVDDDVLVVQTTSGEEIRVENRAWWFAQDQGFSVQVGDQVRIVGFYEDGDVEVGQLTNLTSGQWVTIREESGRPLWAGGGRRGS